MMTLYTDFECLVLPVSLTLFPQNEVYSRE